MKKSLLFAVILSLILGGLSLAGAKDVDSENKGAVREAMQASNDKKPVERKVVFHLSLGLEERLDLALSNIKNLFKAVPPEQCKVHVVANGEGVKLFHKDRVGPRAKDMEDLQKLGVAFSTCWNAMIKQKIEKADLFQACEVVPAGIIELIDLQANGFAYIKP